ncbi:MAG: DUF4350 domain-containing protein [Acidimicrobiia bacterium]
MSLRSTTITAEGRATRRNIETVIATIVAVAVVGWALTEFGRQQTGAGPSGSAFVTDVNGTAAFAELLEDLGHPVVKATAPLLQLDAGGTVLILGPSIRTEYTPDEVDHLRSWVEEGGRLIVAGRPHPDLLGPLLPEDLRQGFDGSSPAPIITPLRGVGGSLESSGIVSARTDAPHLVLAGEPSVAIVFGLGVGEIVYLADGTVLENERIDDNAAWAVSLIAEGPVRFDEVRHGFAVAPAAESPTGLLAALPERARATVLLLLPVLVIALVTYGRRFGPPERTERLLAPPRRELIDAMTGLLSRVDDPVTAGEPVLHRLRSTLTRHAGLPADASDDDIVDSSQRLGLDPDLVRRAIHPTDEDGLFESQRLLAHLSEREHA